MSKFSDWPGAHERHLQRRENNPLFPASRQVVSAHDIYTAQQLDKEALADFMVRFQSVVQRAIDLESNVDSQIILDLKQDLDRSYEECASLPGDQAEIKQAIVRLIKPIMAAVWKGAEQDPQAQSKLRDEETARGLHFQLLETPLVADLLHPETPIQEDELVPCLLSCTEQELDQVLQLFSPEQLGTICADARTLLGQLPPQPTAQARLAQIEAYTTALASPDAIN